MIKLYLIFNFDFLVHLMIFICSILLFYLYVVCYLPCNLCPGEAVMLGEVKLLCCDVEHSVQDLRGVQDGGGGGGGGGRD